MNKQARQASTAATLKKARPVEWRHGDMTDLQRRLLDTGLRLIQRGTLPPTEAGEGVLPIILKFYPGSPLNDTLGRTIVIDAIARTGYFQGSYG